MCENIQVLNVLPHHMNVLKLLRKTMEKTIKEKDSQFTSLVKSVFENVCTFNKVAQFNFSLIAYKLYSQKEYGIISCKPCNKPYRMIYKDKVVGIFDPTQINIRHTGISDYMIVFRNSETSKLHLLIISFFKILKNKNQENVESEQNISVTDCKKSKNCLDSGLNLNNWCKSCHGDPTINLAYQQQ